MTYRPPHYQYKQKATIFCVLSQNDSIAITKASPAPKVMQQGHLPSPLLHLLPAALATFAAFESSVLTALIVATMALMN